MSRGCLSLNFLPGPLLIDYDEQEAKILDQIEKSAASQAPDEVDHRRRIDAGKNEYGSDEDQNSSDLRWGAEPAETDGLLQRPGASRGTSLDDGDGPGKVVDAELANEYTSIRNPIEQKRRIEHYGKLREEYTRPLKIQNLGIFMSYFTVGVVQYFVYAATLSYIIYTLDASSIMTTVLVACFQLPWSFKVFYGLFIDSVGIMGYHRKVWMGVGWVIHTLCNLTLYLSGVPTLEFIIIMVFFMTNGMLMADVAHDTMNVERAKLESAKERGYLQSRAYTLRGCGYMIGAILGAFALESTDGNWSFGLSIGQVYLCNAFMPVLFVGPFLYQLVEITTGTPKVSLKERVALILDVLKLRAVWEPMTFVFIYNIFMTTNPSWYNFEVLALGFDSFDLGLINIGTAMFLFFGYSFYAAFLMDTSWRTTFIGGTCFGALFGLGQLVLENKWNKGWAPDIIFAFGDQAFYQFCIALQLIPVAIMYVSICPPGSEGSVYSLLTTIANLGSSVALVISDNFSNIWDVSNTTIESGDWTGVRNLTILCNALHFLPLVLIRMLPASKQDQIKLRESGEKSELNGMLFGIAILCAFAIAIGSNI